MQVIGAGFFAADAAGAVHDDVGVFLRRQQVFHQRQCFPEGFHIGADGVFKIANFAFVVVAHVHHDGVGRIGQAVEFSCAQVFAPFGDIERSVVQTISHDLVAHFDFEFKKRFPVVVYRNIEPDAFQKRDGVEVFFERFKLFGRHRNLPVDAFFGNINAPHDSELAPAQIQVVAEALRVFDVPVLIKGKRSARLGALLQARFQLLAVEDVVKPWHVL